MIPIDKGIPLPSAKAKKSPWPWDTMEVGDSFVVPDIDARNKAMGAAYYRKMVPLTEKQPDGTYRIWRKK